MFDYQDLTEIFLEEKETIFISNIDFLPLFCSLCENFEQSRGEASMSTPDSSSILSSAGEQPPYFSAQ